MENYARPTWQKAEGKRKRMKTEETRGFSQVSVVAVIETIPRGH